MLLGALLLVGGAAVSEPQAEQPAAAACGAATATTLSLSWGEEPATDLYYVAIARDATTRPLALQTTPTPSITLIDLVPNTEYFLTVRSHPSEFNVVWGWREPTGAPLRCKTAAESAEAPQRLRRVGDSPHESSVALSWRPAPGSEAAAHAVGLRRADAAAAGGWRWEPADSPGAHTARELASGEAYEVAVRDEATGAVSEPLLMRTAAPGVMYTPTYRISEYTFEVASCQRLG